MSQCEYTKPHPKHSWWEGIVGKVGDYRQCEGVQNNPSSPTYEWFTKQALGEFELWTTQPDLNGKHHLHFLFQKGRWEWVVRPGGSSPLCKTPRCRRVTIKETKNA